MGSFLTTEKSRYDEFKSRSPFLSEEARDPGNYRQHCYPFCLPEDRAEENLFEGIRGPALEYFRQHGIKWHDGQDGKPSNHLCDSQVCCANFLCPFADKERALIELLRPVYPTIRRVLPIDDQYVAFEWIGEHNYLRERISRDGQRTRGANFTSADAVVRFEHVDGRCQIVLIEWKYTETYSGNWLGIAKSGTDRREIYRWLYNKDDCPLDRTLVQCFDDFFYEPFYQLMRQQFLAWQMESARELGADIVSLLHIAPEHNLDFPRVTSPKLVDVGASVTGVWKRLVEPARFQSVSVERLFGALPIDRLPELAGWWQYVTQRYDWVREGGLR